MAQNGIPDIVEMRDLRLIEDQAVLKLAGVPRNDPVADNDILADVASVSNVTILADPCRPLDHGTLLNDGPRPDEYSVSDERSSDDLPIDAWFESELKIGLDLRQGLPDILDVVEDDAMLGAAQI